MAVATHRKVINRRVRYETELAAQKKEGHAFFPYAMFHDVVVNLLIVLLIVVMAVVWHVTAGPINASHPAGTNGWLGALYETKANPAVAQTEPRPEWYFLFLFELLRIFKQPWQLIFATIIIPTILMVLLIAWPFLDTGRHRRLSRRPAGVALRLATPAVPTRLTLAGGAAGPGSSLANGSTRFGTDQKALADWIGHGASQAGTGMPAFDQSFNKQQIDQIAQVIASLKTNSVQPLSGG